MVFMISKLLVISFWFISVVRENLLLNIIKQNYRKYYFAMKITSQILLKHLLRQPTLYLKNGSKSNAYLYADCNA